MTRRLFAIALLPEPRIAARVDALRRAVDDPRRADLPSHLTLVPPIPLRPEQVPELRRVLRDAATAAVPFELALGPAASFAPTTSTLHLAVSGALDELSRLRATLAVPPLDRPDEHDFVPHVTLLQRATPEQIAAGLALCSGRLGQWWVRAVHLLERCRPDTGAVWHPVAEEPLGGPAVVGRGGVELHLRRTSVVEPDVAELALRDDPTPTGGGIDAGSVVEASALPVGGATSVTIAELPGAPGRAVGAAFGRADPLGAVLDHVVVATDQRGLGIARQVVQDWCAGALARGAGVVVWRPGAMDALRPRWASDQGVSSSAALPPDDVAELAVAMGFRQVDPTTWCRRIGPVGELGSAT